MHACNMHACTKPWAILNPLLKLQTYCATGCALLDKAFAPALLIVARRGGVRRLATALICPYTIRITTKAVLSLKPHQLTALRAPLA